MGSNFPFSSIAQMEPGQFWAHPESLGLNPEDTAATCANPRNVPVAQEARIITATRFAFNRLASTEIEGRPS